MQNPFRVPRATPATPSTTTGGEAAYDSFIDFDGFPAAQASFADSPSRSTATTSINIDASSNVRKLDPASSAVMMDAGWIRGNARTANHERMAPVVDWPVENVHAEPKLDQKRLQLQPSRSRDQQIFRRKGASGSAGTPSYSSSRGSSVGHGEELSPNSGRGSVIFESYESNNNATQSRDFGSGSGSHRSAAIFENIAQVARADAGLVTGNASQPRNRNNRMDIASDVNMTQNQSNMSKSFGNNSSPVPTVFKKAIPPPPDQTASVSTSPQSVIRKVGVVNKLVSMFSNKQQQQNNQHGQGSSPKPKADTTNNSLHHLKKTITTGVQFHVPTNKSQKQGAPTHMAISQSNHVPSSNPPAISPARSNAQSSVTGYSGDSSSYNPTGWPGTVDKRGKTYVMERSYSESEESSASPQRRRTGKPMGQAPSPSHPPSQMMMQVKYPVQNYRDANLAQNFQTATEQRGFSFDGGSAVAGAAELEDWLKGDVTDDSFAYTGDLSLGSERKSGPIDLDSCYGADQSHGSTGSRSGPVDLDEAYKRRFDSRNVNNGWREGREESLAGISEKTAADLQLEAALGMGNQFRRQAPNKSMSSTGGSHSNQFRQAPNTSISSNAKGPRLNKSMGSNAEGSHSNQFRQTPNKSMNSNAEGSHSNQFRQGPNKSMSSNTEGSHSNQFRQTPNKSMSSNAEGSRSYPSQPTNAMLDDEAKLQGIDLSGSEKRVRASGRLMPGPKIIYNEEVDFDYPSPQRRQQTVPQTLSEEALRWKDRQSAPPSSGGTMMMKGYRGFIDKTKDVPNLMDDMESEASTSLGTTNSRRQRANMGLALPTTGRNSGRTSSLVSSSNVDSGSDIFDGLALPTTRRISGRPSSFVSSSNVDSGSDIFDGLREESFGPIETDILNVNSEDVTQQRRIPQNKGNVKQSMQQTFAHFEGENLPYSTQFNPFNASRGALALNTNVRSRPPHYVDQGSGTNEDFMDPDISAITRDSVGNVSYNLGGFEEEEGDGFEEEEEDDFESLPDLSIYYIEPEMVRKMVRAFRKICTTQMEISSSEDTMLYDFESLVDTKKAFALFEMRSRIMETDIDRGLERRGGTNVVDDIVLTSYTQAATRVRDAVIVSKAWRDGATPKDVVTAHLLTRRSAKAHFVRRPIHRMRRPGKPFYNRGPQYWLEEVKWMDDTDFMLMRCQSLGAGTMKGFEMFTIGDCQSILLKMTSDNCTQLRRELRSAMVRQIEAEELMQEEIDLDGDEHIMAEAEQLYRDSTVEVRTLSIKLVLADKAFTLVRSRMEKLVETIESLLVQIEHGDESEECTSSSTHSDDEEFDDDSYSSQESRDRVKLVERAKRAELSAEVAVREVILAKQEAEKIKSDKQREIDDLKDKLADMETKSQVLESEHRRYLDGQGAKSSYLDKLEAKSFLESTFDKDREEATARKNRLKQKFRERQTQPKEGDLPERNMDEEIYQNLDFYSRSLKSVR